MVTAFVLATAAATCGCKKEEAAPPSAGRPAAGPTATALPTHTVEGVTFAYPAGWTLKSGLAGGGVAALGPTDGDWGPTVALRTYPNPEDKPVDELLQAGIEQMSRKPDFESKGRQSSIDHPGGLRCGRFAYASKDDTKAQVSLVQWYYAVLLPDKRWLEVQASAAADTRDKYEPVFQALVDSIRVKE